MTENFHLKFEKVNRDFTIKGLCFKNSMTAIVISYLIQFLQIAENLEEMKQAEWHK